MTQTLEPANPPQEMNAIAEAVANAISSRRSIRRFTSQPVPRETVEQILSVSSRAPSGTNIQPWRVYVVEGKSKDDLSAALVTAHFDEQGQHGHEFKYYPDSMPEPYLSRRRQVGWALYDLLGIKKGEREKTRQQHARNYQFFGAPVGLIFTIERVLEIGSWLDYGMFLQTIMIAARGAGLHTCPQAAFAQYHTIIREHLPVPQEEIVVCGMSLGYADESAPENTLISPREPLSSFATFL